MHRADIDGLRAVAVLSVIAYHLFPDVIPGGFVGVDVFFVISGFVVTLSILGRDRQCPSRALLDFWRRRILRIFPMLAVMTIASMAVAAALVIPAQPEAYNAIFRSGTAAIAGLANVYFYRAAFDYFVAADQSMNFFLHTWSLGVEEQFYFVYALLFIGAPAILPKLRDDVALALVLIALVIASFGSAFYNAAHDPPSAFFLLHNRFWELGIGGLLALHAHHSSRSMRPSVGRIGRIGAASLLLFALAGDTSIPLYRVALASVGTAMLIGTNECSAGSINKPLRAHALVNIGKISYSLYLWHWPIIVAFRTTVGLDHAVTVLSAIGIVFTLSYLSYRYIEQPFRYSQRPLYPTIFGRAAAVAFVVCAIGIVPQVLPGKAYIGKQHDWTGDWQPPHDYSYVADTRITLDQCDLGSGRRAPSRVPSGCESASGAQRPRLLLIGDSHAYADWGMAAYESVEGPYALATLTHDGCNIAVARSIACAEYWSVAQSLIASLHPGDAVLLSVYWEFGTPVTELAQRTVEELAGIAKSSGVAFVVEAPPPQFPRSAVTCSPEWFRTDYEGCVVSVERFEQQRSAVMAFLGRLRAADSNVSVWDPSQTICDRGTCPSFVNGHPIFRDRHHLSYFGARHLGPAFVAYLKANVVSHARRPESSARGPAAPCPGQRVLTCAIRTLPP